MSITIAVTGGTGLVGRSIVEKLVNRSFNVRILARREPPHLAKGVDLFIGDLNDKASLRPFLTGARFLFHCAAEIRDHSRMESTNVTGTRNIVCVSNEVGIEGFCHLSSVGVIGLTSVSFANEATICSPQNHYERTKAESERIVAEAFASRSVILRPTNVVSERNLGVLDFLALRSTKDYLKLFLKGREVAHIIHVDDVASSALHLAFNGCSGCYIVSTDDQTGGTYGEIFTSITGRTDYPFCPIQITHLIRRVSHGQSNNQSLRYTSKRLMATGFEFDVGLVETIRRIGASMKSLPNSFSNKTTKH